MEQQQQAQMNPQGPVTYMAAPQPFQHPPQSNRIIITSVHVLVMAMSIIGMGFDFSLVRITGGMYHVSAAVATLLFIMAFFWSLAELIVRGKCNWKAGIHPGVHVVVCLVLSLFAAFIGATLATSAALICPNSDGWCKDKRVSPMVVGSPVVALLLAAVEFILFVVACADTLALIRRLRSVAIASRPYSDPPPQWW
ncbi:hypothetical protein X797_010891 [Metarhizium robertsii]|uniref:MARVEL domain-containing protein n=2 Tax=Metarhizium robertsii TaxID=568076 RepID=E9F8V7_METRA|nr:uncharacterized protein MAA_08706 [Metarhizium robertsii ARSEF 23]EFY95898.1 hypothetical protein MAA_08706 [Metarhizium robertsii ARSEF 23]EXU95998.1 hypothetical protein X797_010891 [Metarhizium robertsii]